MKRSLQRPFYYALAAFLWAGGLLALPLRAHGEGASDSVDIMVENAASPWSRPDGTGFANDVVKAAFKEAGIAVNLKVVPYARCKLEVLNGDIAACFSMTWVPEFEGLVELASQPLITLNSDLFERITSPLPRSGEGCKLPSGTAVGIVREYEYPPETMALPAAGIKFEIAKSDQQNLRKLAFGRIDAAIVMTNDLEPKDKKAVNAQVQGKVRFAFNCGHETGTIGFSLKHPRGRTLYQIYESGYKAISENGVLKSITAKWSR